MADRDLDLDGLDLLGERLCRVGDLLALTGERVGLRGTPDPMRLYLQQSRDIMHPATGKIFQERMTPELGD